MVRRQKQQYTLRNISPRLDKVLRQKAKESGKSLNQVAIEALKRGVGLEDEAIAFDDLDRLIGSWMEDKEFEAAILAQDQIDPEDWS